MPYYIVQLLSSSAGWSILRAHQASIEKRRSAQEERTARPSSSHRSDESNDVLGDVSTDNEHPAHLMDKDLGLRQETTPSGNWLDGKVCN